MARYAKLIVAAVGGAIAVLDSLYGPGNQWSTAVVSVATAFGVYAVPNQAKPVPLPPPNVNPVG